MDQHISLINGFYTAFQQKDYVTMQKAYADNAVFSDEVFKNLNAEQVRSMWEMLITRGKDLQLEFKNVEANEKTGSAEWIATYTFTGTGRKVTNRIKARFVFEQGKIVQHTDVFDFRAWAKQALGFKGWLLGGTGFLRKKVQKTALENLENFMQRKHQG